jgi:predicted flap endonuclease-1-like 5' DNA nuclease
MNDVTNAVNLWWWLVLGMWIGWVASWLLSRFVPVTVDKVVERTVNITPYNPQQIERLAALEAAAATIPALQKTILTLQSEEPTTIEKIVDRPVEIVIEKIVEREVENPAHLARIRVLELELAALREPPVPQSAATLDAVAAKAAGFTVRGMDDLEVIEGIGPKIAALFHAAAIRNFWELAQTPLSEMQTILDRGGSRFRLAKPDSWATQAALAAKNDWAALRTMHDALHAGTPRKSGVK